MPFRSLSQITGTFVDATSGLERVHEIIDAPVDVKDEPDAKEVIMDDGVVEFRNVNFEYVKYREVLTILIS